MARPLYSSLVAGLAILLMMVTLLAVPCSSSTCRLACVQADDTFYHDLPNDETYETFSSWVQGPGLLTEGVTIDPKWVDQNTSSPNIYFNDSRANAVCYINVTFVAFSAANRNRMGVFQFDRYGTPGSRVYNDTLQVIFPDITTNEYSADGVYGPCLPQGSTVALGPFSRNASVGFYMDPNGRCVDEGSYQRLWSIDDENLKYDTSGWNPTAKPYGRMASVLQVRHFPLPHSLFRWLIRKHFRRKIIGSHNW
jgi:hypothetical protein